MNTLKKSILAFVVVLFTIPAFAQTANDDCFRNWYSLFRERGTKKVTDGTHDVVLSLRKDQYSECFMARVKVSGGMIVTPVMIAKEDGTYEEFSATGKKIDPAFLQGKSEADLLKITDGMSITFYTTDRETAKLFFYTFVNEPKKGNKVAPPVGDLVKN
jgi:hypothetical protein